MMCSFGKLEDGRGIEAVTLGSDDSLQVEVLTYGAILRRLTLSGTRRAARPDPAFRSPGTLRARPRLRRIAGGPLRQSHRRQPLDLDGKTHTVTANEGVNHLHGGALGFGKRVWRVLEVNENKVTAWSLDFDSPDGEEGFPGNVEATVALNVEPNALAIVITAHTDAPTPVNLTYHPYFNLAGNSSAPVTDHWLRIPPRTIYPSCRADPHRRDRAGDGHAVRFSRRRGRSRRRRRARTPSSKLAGGYDHCWVLDATPIAPASCQLRRGI